VSQLFLHEMLTIFRVY